MKSRKLRRIWGQPWDYGFLLEIEQHKIREMAAYFKKSQLTEGWELQVRDLELCDRLIDIILEKDRYYKSWLHNCYDSLPHKHLSFTPYVNDRNYKRFIPTADISNMKDCLLPHWHVNLRQKKALFLYNKIRAFRIHSWWD